MGQDGEARAVGDADPEFELSSGCLGTWGWNYSRAGRVRPTMTVTSPDDLILLKAAAGLPSSGAAALRSVTAGRGPSAVPPCSAGCYAPSPHFIVVDRPWTGCVWELPPIAHEQSTTRGSATCSCPTSRT